MLGPLALQFYYDPAAALNTTIRCVAAASLTCRRLKATHPEDAASAMRLSCQIQPAKIHLQKTLSTEQLFMLYRRAPRASLAAAVLDVRPPVLLLLHTQLPSPRSQRDED